MRTSRWILTALLLAGPTSAFGHENEASEGLEERIKLEFAGAAAVDVFRSLASIANAEPELDPELDGEVTMQLSNVSARTVADALCEMLDCKWWLEEGPPRKLRVKANAGPLARAAEPPATLDTPVTLSLADAPAEEVLKSFASIGRWKLQMERDLVTLELDEVTVRDALDIVCEMVDCSWSPDLVGDEGVLRIEWPNRGGDQ